MWRNAFGREQREPQRLRVTPRLAHLATRGRRNHLIDLEVVRVGKVDQQHGEVPRQGHDAVPRPEVERIQRHVPHIAEAERDEIPPPPERLLRPAHAPRNDHPLQRQFEPDEPVQACQLGYPGDPDIRGASRPSGRPALSGERYERRLAQRSQPGAGPHFGSFTRRKA